MCIITIIEPITSILWDPSSLYLVSAGGDDRYVRVWNNVHGMKEQIKNDEEEMRSAKSEALKVLIYIMTMQRLCSPSLSLSIGPSKKRH